MTFILDATNIDATIELHWDDAAKQRNLHIRVDAKPALGTDRLPIMGWSLGARASARGLAERLRSAILAGKVFGPATIRTDVNGKTYVSADAFVLGRRMNADLRRLGF